MRSIITTAAGVLLLGVVFGCEQEDIENPYNAPTAPVIDDSGVSPGPMESEVQEDQ